MRVNHGFIALPLTDHAGTHTRQCLAPTSGDGLATIFAMLKAFTSGHPRASPADCVAYCIINLILHRAIARPSAGHINFLAPIVVRRGNAQGVDQS